LVATADSPALRAEPAPAAAPVAAAPLPAAPAAPAAPLWATRNFLRSSSGPTGKTAASARFVAPSCLSNARQRSHSRTWRRIGGERRSRPSATSPSSKPDLLAAQAAGLGGLGERHAGADEQRLDRRHRGVHRLGDLLVGERVDLAQEQRRPLRLGQRLHVPDELAELLALVDLVGRGAAVVGEVDVHRVHPDGGLPAQVVQAPVARDR
jgi:hypothetical protein